MSKISVIAACEAAKEFVTDPCFSVNRGRNNIIIHDLKEYLRMDDMVITLPGFDEMKTMCFTLGGVEFIIVDLVEANMSHDELTGNPIGYYDRFMPIFGMYPNKTIILSVAKDDGDDIRAVKDFYLLVDIILKSTGVNTTDDAAICGILSYAAWQYSMWTMKSPDEIQDDIGQILDGILSARLSFYNKGGQAKNMNIRYNADIVRILIDDAFNWGESIVSPMKLNGCMARLIMKMSKAVENDE